MSENDGDGCSGGCGGCGCAIVIVAIAVFMSFPRILDIVELYLKVGR
jgi:hypothetical protein